MTTTNEETLKQIEAAERLRPVEVGDVFANSWGYDQTNIDFYVVERVSASGKTCWIHEVESAVLDSTSGSDHVVPLADKPKMRRQFESVYNDEPPHHIRVEIDPLPPKTLTKKIRTSSNGEPNLNMPHGWCSRVAPWDSRQATASTHLR